MAKNTYIDEMRHFSTKLGFDKSIYEVKKPARIAGHPVRLTRAQRNAVERVSTERIGWRPFRAEALGYNNGVQYVSRDKD